MGTLEKNSQMSPLANTSIRILHMHATELPVEHLFSHLKYLESSKIYQKSEDLLNIQ